MEHREWRAEECRVAERIADWRRRVAARLARWRREAGVSRCIPERSVSLGIVIDRLRQLGKGEEIARAELHSLTKIEDWETLYPFVYRAARTLLRKEMIVLAILRGGGIRRLDDTGIIGTGVESAARLRRAARRGLQKVVCAEYQELTQEEKNRHNLYASFLGVVAEMAKGSRLKRIEAAVSEEKNKLPFDAVLRAYGVGGKGGETSSAQRSTPPCSPTRLSSLQSQLTSTHL